MSVGLTSDDIIALLKDAAAGQPEGLLNIIDPNVRWRIGSDVKDAVSKTGIYNRASWLEEVLGPLQSKLQNGLDLIPLEVDIVRNKAYVEFLGKAIQKNGKPYDNHYIWVIIFDSTDHVIEIREYLDTGLVKEVFTSN